MKKRKATKTGKTRAARKPSTTRDLPARRSARGGLLPYIEQDNLIAQTGPGGGPHLPRALRKLGR